ncbi:MAG: sulfotransferase domain-containing protein, partial [Cyanobacteria bacterium J06649_4]
QSFEDINLHDLFRFSEVNPTLPSIKPMHEKYGQFGNSYERQKVIVLVRDPRDAIISRYHQHKSELTFNELEQYVLDSADFDAYIQFYNDWQTHKSEAQGVLVVRYEDMKADAIAQVRRVFEFIGLPITDDELRQAVEYASFKNMRKMEVEGSAQVRAGVMSTRNVTDPESFKVRKGSIGGYKAELSEEAIAQLNAKLQQLNPIYGYQ